MAKNNCVLMLHNSSFVFSIQRVDFESFFFSARLLTSRASRMATGGYEAATSMIHRRRVSVKRGENRIES